ncbi:hypothetical protein D9758_017353 [Tetrapyrgos nigripes]|uniref:Uncharacterized protein n=1 Tax=Tetrapyrgos nigripes TaxID=182062 RepID=A0A8H5C440_9AGAR|nr:hypothetical protein D9758_017353 [Tetrapyrgos nigripes]
MANCTVYVLGIDDAEYSLLPSSGPIRRSRTPSRMMPYPQSALSSPPVVLPASSGSTTGLDSTQTSVPRTHMRTRRMQTQYSAITVEYPSKSCSGITTTMDHDEILCIPKPDGENGRPGRSGYALKKVLGWSGKDYKKAFVKKLVETTLADSIYLPYTRQPVEQLNDMRAKMLNEFPVLAN